MEIVIDKQPIHKLMAKVVSQPTNTCNICR